MVVVPSGTIIRMGRFLSYMCIVACRHRPIRTDCGSLSACWTEGWMMMLGVLVPLSPDRGEWVGCVVMRFSRVVAGPRVGGSQAREAVGVRDQ